MYDRRCLQLGFTATARLALPLLTVCTVRDVYWQYRFVCIYAMRDCKTKSRSELFNHFLLMRQMSDHNFPAQVDENSGYDYRVMIAWSAPRTITTSECGHNNFPSFHLVIAATGQPAGIRNLSLRVADKWCRISFIFVGGKCQPLIQHWCKIRNPSLASTM